MMEKMRTLKITSNIVTESIWATLTLWMWYPAPFIFLKHISTLARTRKLGMNHNFHNHLKQKSWLIIQNNKRGCWNHFLLYGNHIQSYYYVMRNTGLPLTLTLCLDINKELWHVFLMLFKQQAVCMKLICVSNQVV